MRKTAIHCTGEKDGQKCGNILGYISEGKLICLRHGRAIEVASGSIGDGKVIITCERCGKKTVVETSAEWHIKF